MGILPAHAAFNLRTTPAWSISASKLVSPAVAGPGLTLESLPVRRRSPMTARIRHDRRSATAAASQSDETRPAPAESRIVSSALNGLAAEAGAPNAGEQTGNHVPGRSGIRPLVQKWGERRNHLSAGLAPGFQHRRIGYGLHQALRWQRSWHHCLWPQVLDEPSARRQFIRTRTDGGKPFCRCQVRERTWRTGCPLMARAALERMWAP